MYYDPVCSSLSQFVPLGCEKCIRVCLTFRVCLELEDLNAMKVWTVGKETEGEKERDYSQ